MEIILLFSLLCKPDASVFGVVTGPISKEIFPVFLGLNVTEKLSLRDLFPPNQVYTIGILAALTMEYVWTDNHCRRAAGNITHELCRSAKQLQQSLKEIVIYYFPKIYKTTEKYFKCRQCSQEHWKHFKTVKGTRTGLLFK